MAAGCKSTSRNMADATEGVQPDLLAVPENRPEVKSKAVVVGIYGLPGSGKTFLIDQLKQELKGEPFAFFEGSDMIATVVPGGLDAFQTMGEDEKVHWRQVAIDAIGEQSAYSGQAAVVAGHFMFWAEEANTGRIVYTQNDLNTFTHIIYLDVPAEVVAQRRLDDTERNRPSISVAHLRKWQEEEKTQLAHLCRCHGILFTLASPHPRLVTKMLRMVRDFRYHSETYNLSQVERKLDGILSACQSWPEKVLMMDADRTLAAEDTGALYWKLVSKSRHMRGEECSLRTLFTSPLGYSYTAFRQATLLYEETADDQEFDVLCQEVASTVTMHPEFLSLLQLVAEQEHVTAVVVSCGLGRVWDMVLEREGLSRAVKVLGGGRIADGFVVTPAVKAALAVRLRHVHRMQVWAFGDSPLDLGMLSKAHQAIVVVGEEQTRSKTMDALLMNAIDNHGLKARQVVLPASASPRLNTTRLPSTHLTKHELVDSILGDRTRHANFQVLDATNRTAAKLLMTPMRNAAVAGPVLREVHRRVGWYLATEFLGDVIGVEEYAIPHVQGRHTGGYRLFHERQTTIVALMRGGEAMALGVDDAFPLAMFVHASRPDDVKIHHLQGQINLVLVDSVINSGKTVAQFVQHARNLHATIRIVVVAGVAQAQAVSRESLAQLLAPHARLSLIALRLSDNKFVGQGTTDTGNRLFNTTHLA